MLDGDGKPRFDELMGWPGRAIYTVLDPLLLDGEDLLELPLWQRKLMLETHLVRPFGGAFYVSHIENYGSAIL